MTETAPDVPAIDVHRVDTGMDLTATIMDAVPMARDIARFAVLAPSVIPADLPYGNLASLGIRHPTE